MIVPPKSIESTPHISKAWYLAFMAETSDPDVGTSPLEELQGTLTRLIS